MAFVIHSRHSVRRAIAIQVLAEAAASSTPIFASPSTEKAQFRAALRLSTSPPSALSLSGISIEAPCLNKSQKYRAWRRRQWFSSSLSASRREAKARVVSSKRSRPSCPRAAIIDFRTKLPNAIRDICFIYHFVSDNGDRRFECKSAGKNTEPAQYALLCLIKQVIAPLQRGV